ncbi:CsbD family protein [Actinosynnema sp. NPDC020468]|uniref:CsbD family protein n=1 Tax=Actinosynnema sp. NPDC020468 TaxID=3154488 RepID=UPI0033DC704D
MSQHERFEDKAQDLGGKAKEAVGDVTGDDELRAEGKADQLKAGVKDAAHKVEDAVESLADKVKGAFKK